MKSVAGRTATAKGGFTLVEGIVTVLILSILSIAVFPKVNSIMIDWRLDAAAEEFAAHLRYARKLAMESGSPIHINLANANEHSYYVHPGDWNPVEDPLNPTEALYKIIRYAGGGDSALPEYRGFQLNNIYLVSGNGSSNCWFTFGSGCSAVLIFDADGIPYRNGTTPGDQLVSPAQLFINEKNNMFSPPWRIIVVMPETGHVVVQ